MTLCYDYITKKEFSHYNYYSNSEYVNILILLINMSIYTDSLLFITTDDTFLMNYSNQLVRSILCMYLYTIISNNIHLHSLKSNK